MSLIGRWRIVAMEMWDQEAIDLMGPGFIEFGPDQSGRLQFIAVEGQLDCRDTERDGRECVEFSWEGFDDADEASGRGWAVMTDDATIEGHIFFHLGDDSSLRAVRFDAEPHATSSPAQSRRGATR